MKELIQSVAEFHRGFGVPVNDRPTLPATDRRELRIRLLQEEWHEYLEAERKRDMVEIADALGDMLYVIVGTALEYGIPIEAVVREICASNASKVGGPMREDGKILKGPGYFKPKLAEILEAAAARAEYWDERRRAHEVSDG